MVGTMAFKFMHAADIHLDSPLRGLERYVGAPVEAMRSATRRAFDNLVEACVEEQVDFLLLAGDLYDGQWRDYNTVLHFTSQLNKLRAAEVRVFVVLGNHDAENRMSKALRTPKGVKVFRSKEPETVEIDELSVAVHGQSYAQQEVTEDLSAGFPRPVAGVFNIGLLHTSADGRASEHKPYAPCSVASLVNKGYQYWALGHIHQRTELSREPWVIFPGNLQGRHVRETGAKGAALVHVDDAGRARVEYRDFDVLRWHVCEVAVEDADSPQAALDRAEAQLIALRGYEPERPLAVRVHLVGRTAAHAGLLARPEHWTTELRAMAGALDDVWVEKVRFSTQTPLDLNHMRSKPGSLGTLLRCIDECRHDKAILTELSTELAPMRKVMAELHDGPHFESPEELRAILDEIEQMLLPMLLEGGRER